jgi:hypothetical protein
MLFHCTIEMQHARGKFNISKFYLNLIHKAHKNIYKVRHMLFYFTQKSTGHNYRGIEAVYPERPKAYDSILGQCYSNCVQRNPGLSSAGDFQGLCKHISFIMKLINNSDKFNCIFHFSPHIFGQSALDF